MGELAIFQHKNCMKNSVGNHEQQKRHIVITPADDKVKGMTCLVTWKGDNLLETKSQAVE